MDPSNRDPLYSDDYKCADFHWGISLGEGMSKLN